MDLAGIYADRDILVGAHGAERFAQPVQLQQRLALLDAGQAKEAEAVYHEELRRNPGNGWSLYGLSRALAAQGRDREAATTERAFNTAWANADVELVASRF